MTKLDILPANTVPPYNCPMKRGVVLTLFFACFAGVSVSVNAEDITGKVRVIDGDTLEVGVKRVYASMESMP